MSTAKEIENESAFVESSSRPTSGFDFDGAPQPSSGPTSSSGNSAQPTITYFTVQITGTATNVQIGSNNIMDITKAESDKRMVPLSEVHDPAGEELMFRRLADESYRREYVRRMREQDVPSTIAEVGRGCIFLNLQVETPAAAQKLLEMCRDGSYQRILMETFLPEYVTSGKPMEMSLAVSVKTPDVPPVRVTIVEENPQDKVTVKTDQLQAVKTLSDSRNSDGISSVDVPVPGTSTTRAKSPQLQRLVATEGRPRQTSSDSGLGSADWDTDDLLCETLFISVDPYMRLFGRSLKEGDTMIGEVLVLVLVLVLNPQTSHRSITRMGEAQRLDYVHGCKVIGCAGTDDKVIWLRDLGFDYVFNYKTKSLGEELKKAAPEGIDCYFDNVGGDFSVSVLNNHMKDHGRVAVCGSISTYNNPEVKGHYFFETIITKRLKLQGFIGAEYQAEWPAATTQVAKWIVEGKVKHKEHVANGFDQTPQALIGVLTGKNTGKAIVKI
uniref:Alcohol dehydrogenase-like C-terminal domain-containing protein n=1 Tax=Branchiostoma floridae TaxID=7739 RepID=C3ZYZ8_BRAFL|eukprot:XP_002586223.1 hypothetical protein BRAFLDRAFT_109550 [Branchiostoma floridae]